MSSYKQLARYEIPQAISESASLECDIYTHTVFFPSQRWPSMFATLHQISNGIQDAEMKKQAHAATFSLLYPGLLSRIHTK